MGKKFSRLPARYRQAIDGAIATVDGGENPHMADLYRDHEAQSLLECDLRYKARDTAEQIEERLHLIGNYSWFMTGYRAAAAELH